MTTPIFVLGKHRSGTTWLANQLCQHSHIVGVQHEVHGGIHESAYFSTVYGRYGDLANRSNFIELVEVLSASDYFRLAGATKEFLYTLSPTTYEDLFRRVMDNFAVQNGASHWLEKTPTHSPLISQLAAFYPDARFIAVTRDVTAVVRSTLAMMAPRHGEMDNINRTRRALIVRTVFSWTYYNKCLKAFGAKSDRLLSLHYDAMCADLASTLREACHFLNLDFEMSMCDRAYAPNTSFEGQSTRKDALSKQEEAIIHTLARLSGLMPLMLLRAVHNIKSLATGRQALPNWFFLLYPHPQTLRTRKRN